MSAPPTVPALEDQLGDVISMAGISATLVEGLFDSIVAAGHMSPDRRKQFEQLTYAIYETEKKAAAALPLMPADR